MEQGQPPAASSEPGLPTTGKGTLTTAAVGISSCIVLLANRLENQLAREALGFLAPVLGTGVTYLARLLTKQFYHWRGNQQLQRWIKALLAERPKALPARRREIDADLAEYRAKLKQRRLDNLP